VTVLPHDLSTLHSVGGTTYARCGIRNRTDGLRFMISGNSEIFTFRRWRSDDRGFALVSVLFIAILIALLASTMLVMVRVLANDSNMFVSEITARYATEAGLNRAILAFSRSGDPLRELMIPDGRPVRWDFHGRSVVLRAQAESGKLDLNAGEKGHITELLGRLIDDPRVRQSVLANIDEARSRGARITSIAAAVPVPDRLFWSLDALAANFTVFTNQLGFDPMTAPTLVLETMPGLTEEARRLITNARERDQPLPLGRIPGSVARGFAAERPIYTFHVETSTGFVRAYAMLAIAGFDDQGDVSIYAWSQTSLKQ
jgi:hypothetical protein